MALATRWVETCLRDHPHCSRPLPAKLLHWTPKRLIDLDTKKPGLRLSESPEISSDTRYTTLSHRWGKLSKRSMLTTENLKIWGNVLPENELSQTFKDAISVTRSLGIKYIWIDSLCIIQNSTQDWLEQSALMSNIYKYSYCNIAATAAEDDSQGCFFNRDPDIIPPIQFDLSGYQKDSVLAPTDHSSDLDASVCIFRDTI